MDKLAHLLRQFAKPQTLAATRTRNRKTNNFALTQRLIILSICTLTLAACGHSSDTTKVKQSTTVDTTAIILKNTKPCDTTRLAQATAKGWDNDKRFLDKDYFEMFFIHQVDSIYLWTEGKCMPKILFDTYFDKRHPGYWPCLHCPVSLRKQILDSICDCSILMKVLTDTNKRLDKTDAPLMIVKKQPTRMYDFKIPLSEYSIRELTKMRFKELDCKQ